MKELAWIAGLAVLALMALSWMKGQRRTAGSEAPKPRAVMTEREQGMYLRLVEAFPGEVVLAQVAFSALLNAKNREVRNRFDRKVADFVVCTKGFKVLAVVELDDRSHRGREEQDAARSALLTNAGYKVVRFDRVPDVMALKKAISQ